MGNSSAVKTRSAASSDPVAVGPAPAWSDTLTRDLEASRYNPCVGTVLVSETDRVRIWHLHLPPGKRCSFHRHVLDYFWTCHTFGSARGYFEDGTIRDAEHFPGDTRHLCYGAGEYMVHSVENIGSTDLVFTTVEFLQSANLPLPLPPDVPRRHPSSKPAGSLHA